MATDRKLINYLPSFMQLYREMATIMETEQTEIDHLWLETDNALADQFIQEATENGVKRWESMLGISPKDTDTLDERKFRIHAKLNQELPYTIKKLSEMLNVICGGARNYELSHDPWHYWIKVRLGIANQNNYQEVVDLLKKMVPANMTQTVEILYNSNNVISQMTHTQLTEYTHKQLREEVFE